MDVPFRFPPIPASGSRVRGVHAPPHLLYKQRSWSPDMGREEAWLRRKRSIGKGNRSQRSKSVTDEDLDELKACIELGFGFDSPEPADRRLAETLPALGFYYAVNKHYNDSLSKPSVSVAVAVATPSNSSTPSECDSPSPSGSPHAMFGPDDTPQTVKTRLRQWAQVVACSVKQCSSS